MKTVTKWGILAAFLILSVVLLWCFCSSMHCYLHKHRLVKMINDADRVDGYEWDSPDVRISYVGQDLQKVVKAIKESIQDDTPYDTPVGVIQVEFYHKSTKLVQIGTCGDLFHFEGKQYRTRNDVLRNLIDLRLYELRNPPARTQEAR